MKVLFCQISNKLLNTKTKNYSTVYYNTWYDIHQEDGYTRPEDFWEIPMWVAEISYCIKNKELHVVHDVESSIKYINSSDADIVLFSVLDVNKEFVLEISNKINKQVCTGGYSKVESDRIKWFDSIKDLCEYLQIEYRKGTDYSLFKNVKTIPRLQLSQGCKHRCKFCTIPKIIIENNLEEIGQQIDSFKDLDFKLIYIDDKTFGQASNYTLLMPSYEKIIEYNPNFKGFIIQTTAIQVAKLSKEIDLRDLHIFAIEIGVESYNDSILSSLRKPASEKSIRRAVEICKLYDINIIYNIIVGLPEETKETYLRTLNFIVETKPYGLNIFNLAIYKNTELSKELNIVDPIESKLRKRYNSIERNRLNKWFSDSLYLLGLDNLFYNNDTV